MCTCKGQAHTHVHIVTAAFLWCCSLGSLQESPPGRPSPDYSLFGSFSKHLSSLTSRLRGNCLNTDWSLCILILSFSRVCLTPLCPNIDVFRRYLVSIYFSQQTGRGAQPRVSPKPVEECPEHWGQGRTCVNSSPARGVRRLSTGRNRLPMQGTGVPSLGGELRGLMPRGR